MEDDKVVIPLKPSKQIINAKCPNCGFRHKPYQNSLCTYRDPKLRRINIMEDKAIAYQQQMQNQYNQSFRGLRRKDYQDVAGIQFKKEYSPADLDGILVDANYLDVADLVTIYKAAAVLKTQGYEVLAKDLIAYKQSEAEEWSVVVRVNPQYMKDRRQRHLQISELLQYFYCGDWKSYATKRQEICDKGDAQLYEMLGQTEEALEITLEELIRHGVIIAEELFTVVEVEMKNEV